MSRRPLALGLVVAALLALPPSAAAVLPGENGRIVYISGPAFANTQLFLRGVTGSTGGGSTTGPLSPGLVQRRHPTWSPDRTKIAFAQGPGGATGYDIFILDLTTPNATPDNITNSPGVTDDRPAWSPDGTRIAFESGSDIIVRTLNGGGNLPLTTTLAPRAWKAAWSPSSRTLYYSVGDISVAPNGNNNDVKIYRQPANNSSAGTELPAHQRRPCVPALDLPRRNEALLHDQHSSLGPPDQRRCPRCASQRTWLVHRDRGQRRGRLQLHLVARRNH